MRLWLVELRKDIGMMRTFGIVSMVCVAIVGLLLVVPSYRMNAGHFTAFGTVILTMVFVLEVVYLPVHLVISIVREWRGTAGFWLQSPQSGWALIASKTVAAIVWTLAVEVVTAMMLIWSLFRTLTDIRHAIPSTQWMHVQLMTEHVPQLAMYGFVGVFIVGLFAGFWLTLICMAMRSVRYRMRGLPWLTALVVFLIWTWGLTALQNTGIYHRIFDFGQFSTSWIGILSGTNVAGNAVHGPMIHLYVGHVLWYAVILAIVFYLSGWLLDKRVEI